MDLTPFPSDVGVAIVCHNNRDTLALTLASLEAAGCPLAAVSVMDVASTDGTSDWLRRDYPAVRLVQIATNDGPNPARNTGIRSSPFPFVFLMDADVEVRPDTVQRLRVALADDVSIGIGSPIVVHGSAPDTIQYAGTSLHFICEAINPWMDRPLAARGCESRDIGVASSCGLLLRRQTAIDIGLFDERFFMGKDDGDFTHRMRIAGHRIVEPPAAIVVHRSRPRSTWLFYYQIRNRWYFMLKNYQWRTLLFMLPVLAVHEPLQAVFLHLKGFGGVYWKAVGGLIAMLPALGRDRRFIRRIRVLPDRLILHSAALIVRDDLASRGLARQTKRAYDAFLNAYWRLLTKTVLAR